ncbi:MAG: helicase [Deltaproteobacteria bacterium]|nr:helicase [Deltaproteobacteria bacterium]
MKLPYVIDNQTHVLAEILKGLLTEHKGRSLDVATAYFTVGGFGLVKEGLTDLGNFRLLLGAEPTTGEQVGLRPDAGVIKGLIRKDLEEIPFDENTLRLVEDLIAYLQRESVQVRLHDKGFLHAKCWLFYSDRPGQQMLFDRFRPILAIVGSSNFTFPGLTSNRELNLAHKVLLDTTEAEDRDAAYAVSWLTDTKPSERITVENRQLLKSEVGARAIIDLESWYERQWGDGLDFKQDLIALLDASKFGRREYTPFQVYMKALYEYFKDELGGEVPTGTRSAVNLAEFQEDAVKKARKILARYDGVMVADSVGLGKTWIGKKLLEDFAYHMRQKALVVCPASLREMWGRELSEANIAATILSQEELGREEFDPSAGGDADIVVIDESHNFRNQNAQRYGSMETLLGANGGRGREGGRKKVILLTATPINNDLFDLYSQFSLVTRGDRSYFASCGIGDLYRYFLKARRDSRSGDGVFALFNLLEEVVIRRTRPFIRTAYPNATIRTREPDGTWVEQAVRFPDRKLKTVYYNLEATYTGIYDEVVSGIESLKLAPYNLEDYKKAGVEVDKFEAGREEALVGIFKSRYLKRFESSIEAFRISVRRALAFLKTFESYILGGRLIKSTDFHRILRFLSSEEEEDDATPISLADEIDANEEARAFLETLGTVDPTTYDLRKLHDAVQHDVDVLSQIWQRVKDIKPAKDAKLTRLKELLSKELKGKKVLIFSYYKDTARYLYRHLGHPDNPDAVAFCKKLGGITVRRMDSGADTKERQRIIQGFAPKANGKPDWVGTDKEIDVLISTDVLSEGQNLQDCGYLVNYDLHWNPTRMVQRAGRIDRIGTEFEMLWINNIFPDQGLDRLLGLVESLSQKIADIDRAGFLDASVLGETVHPRNFNTIRRIREEDGSVIEEEEQFTELASSEFLMQQLRALLDAGGKEVLESLPDGIHSGLAKAGARGVFFYFQARQRKEEKIHFWKYYDLKEQRIIDNRYIVANLIACQKDTPRAVDPDVFRLVFDLQEQVIEDILQSEEEKRALEVAPRSVDPIQQTVATALQSYLNHPDVDRNQAIQAIRFLNQPMLRVQAQKLRQAYRDFQGRDDIRLLLGSIQELRKTVGGEPATNVSAREMPGLKREDLSLICFDLIGGG